MQIGNNKELLQGKLSHISFSNFQTLGVGQWLDDEVINYFVQKWCAKSRTILGLNTFFACRILFQEDSCINAKDGILTKEDETKALRWCQKAEVGTSCVGQMSTLISL
jgi:hypothetical protein